MEYNDCVTALCTPRWMRSSRPRGAPRSYSVVHSTWVRAWPVCLRPVAVQHVRSLVQSLSLLPRSPQIVEDALQRSHLDTHVVRDWLWQLAPRSDVVETNPVPMDPVAVENTWTSSEALLYHKIKEHMVSPVTGANLMTGCEVQGVAGQQEPSAIELSEPALRSAAELRYGAVTDAERTRLQRHLGNLATLVEAVASHSPINWPERKRRICTDRFIRNGLQPWLSPIGRTGNGAPGNGIFESRGARGACCTVS